jgi:tRNA A37 threonylcarbamoyladenosine dehydratase
MGAGGKLDPTKLKVADLFDTSECSLAHYVRKRMRKYGITSGIKAVYSTEKVMKESLMHTDGSNYKRSAYGTISYLPAAFGGACASVVIRDLVGESIPEIEEGINRRKKEAKKAKNAEILQRIRKKKTDD